MRRLLQSNDLLLLEAAVVERLRRSGRVELHPRLVHALLVREAAGQRELRSIYQEYIDIAAEARVPLILCTPTWRASRDRLEEAGVGQDVNADAVRFLKQLASDQGEFGSRIRIGGLIGCRNDCYIPEEGLSAAAAERFHAWQLERLATAGADFLMASTLPAVEEAVGIARAMAATGTPYVISFVIDRTGRVLDGTPLLDALNRVDGSVDPAPLGFMVNCAYPSFLRPDGQPAALFDRLVGYQANASSLDHCDLDGAAELSADDVSDWAERMLELKRRFGLRILGGCCGTGPEHLRHLARRGSD